MPNDHVTTARIRGPEDCGLIVVDVQTALMKAFPRPVAERNIYNMTVLVRAARLLDIPIWVTQQYTRGLGPTVEVLQEALGDAPVFEKITFSCADDPEFRNAVRDSGRRTLIVLGTEAHVCVLQTALDLMAAGYRVHVPSDAVLSRFGDDFTAAMALLARTGVVVSRSETIAFQWLQRAEGPTFKAISELVKGRNLSGPLDA